MYDDHRGYDPLPHRMEPDHYRPRSRSPERYRLRPEREDLRFGPPNPRERRDRGRPDDREMMYPPRYPDEPLSRRSRSRSFERDRRDRSRSPQRRRLDDHGLPPLPSLAQLPPSGPRALLQKPPNAAQGNSQLVEYSLTLPNPGLVRFLIGPSGTRARVLKEKSNVIRLTFAEESTRDGVPGTGVGIGRIRGGEPSIKRALEGVRGAIEEELDKERASGVRGPFEYGDYRHWTTWDESHAVWVNKTKEELVESQQGRARSARSKSLERGAYGSEGDRRDGPLVRAGSPRGRRDGDMHRLDSDGNPSGSIHGLWAQPPVSAMASVPHHAPGNQPHQQPFYISQKTYEDKDRREKQKAEGLGYAAPDVVIPVPPIAVAALIGPKGSTIRTINAKTGAYSRIDRSGPLPLLNIFGDRKQVLRIFALMDPIIVQHDSTWTGGMQQTNTISPAERGMVLGSEPAKDNGPLYAPTKPQVSNGAAPAAIAVIEKPKEAKVEKTYTEEELSRILDSLPPGMLERVLVKRFSESQAQ